MPRGSNQQEVELRFKVGGRVQCKVGAGEEDWASGQIVKLWYRESNWPKKKPTAPYQVQLDDGRLIYAPLDDDRVCRALEGLLLDGKIPVTVLTGYLGAGKTTLLNYILKTNHGKKYAVIENEVGSVGIDNQLLQDAGYKQDSAESITILDNGCLCCTVRGDLVKAIKDIVDAAQAKKKEGEAKGEVGKALDGILIETTGVADPGPICKTFYGDAFCSAYCKIDGVITLVDALYFLDQISRERSEGAVNESAQQVAFADKVLLNKVDAVKTPQRLERTLEAVKSVNPFVPVTKCSLGKSPDQIPLETLLSIDAFDLSKLKEDLDMDLSVCASATEEKKEEEHAHGHGHEHHHHDGEHKECAEDCDNPDHHHDHGHDHGHDHDHDHECDENCDHDHDHKHGHDDHGKAKLEKFRHDADIGSFLCELKDKPLDEQKFHQFIGSILNGNSENLYRFKGILAVRSENRVVRQVIQGVHDQVDFDETGEWPKGTPYRSQLVLIGRKVPEMKDEWTKQFEECAS